LSSAADSDTIYDATAVDLQPYTMFVFFFNTSLWKPPRYNVSVRGVSSQGSGSSSETVQVLTSETGASLDFAFLLFHCSW
jgi:hypothetical protein